MGEGLVGQWVVQWDSDRCVNTEGLKPLHSEQRASSLYAPSSIPVESNLGHSSWEQTRATTFPGGGNPINNISELPVPQPVDHHDVEADDVSITSYKQMLCTVDHPLVMK